MPAPANRSKYRLINLGTDRKVFGPWYDEKGLETAPAIHLASTDPVDPGRAEGSVVEIDGATKARLEKLTGFTSMVDARRVEIRAV